LLDTSGSMLENPAGPSGVIEPVVANRKYSIAAEALRALVGQYHAVLHIGLAIFPSDGMCGAATLNIPPALDTQERIKILLSNSSPVNFLPDTPTSASINSLVASEPLKDASRSQYILLVTDGKPGCLNGSENVTKAVAALSGAAKATPPVKTFVVGFGQLGAIDQAALNQMADAGGVPSSDPSYHYYRADSGPALVASLDKILTQIGGYTSGAYCEDSCYNMGCAGAAEKCVAGTCQPDRCAGVVCKPSQFCYTDGTSPGVCTDICPMTCAADQYCDRGRCVSTPCGPPCAPGSRCNQDSKQCEPDPACADLSPQCQEPRGCVGGKCIDDPCGSGFIKCPAGTTCTPWAGTCQPVADGASPGPCGCRLPGRDGNGSATAILTAALLATLALRRTASRARRRREPVTQS
jgi:hypothetical protein